MEQIYMYTPAVHGPAAYMRPMPQNLMFPSALHDASTNFWSALKKSPFGPLRHLLVSNSTSSELLQPCRQLTANHSTTG